MRPDVAVITTIEPAHLGFFASVEAIADAKAEIFNGMTAKGAAVLNRDNPHFERLAAAARARGLTRILGFGSHAEAEVRLIDCHLYATASAVTASVMGEIVDYCVAIPGRHWVMNSLAVVAAVKAAGGDVAAAAAAMGGIEPHGRARPAPQARPARRHRRTHRRELQREPRLDARRACGAGRDRARRPAAGASPCSATCSSWARPRRGSMPNSPSRSPRRIVDLVFTVGRDMRALFEALPQERRGGHAATAEEMAETLAQRLRPGDVVTVKGSFGSGMRAVVARLLAGEAAVCAVKG